MAKFKKKKERKVYKKAKTQQLPSNYRIIPENINKDELIFFTGILCILVAVLVVSFNLYSNIKEEKRINDQKVVVLNQKAFWENEVKMHPNYRDAYFSSALINYQLQDYKKSKYYLNYVFRLDPNFKEGRELEKLLK